MHLYGRLLTHLRSLKPPIRPIKILVLFIILYTTFLSYHASHTCQKLSSAQHLSRTTSSLPDQPPIEDEPDTFSHYAYRHHPQCNISSPSLFHPTPNLPPCTSSPSFLAAFSSGGRIGLDAPFQSRYCNMRWYTTSEICAIMSRFEKIIIVGDSMMRHVVGALNVLLRKDLGYGAVTNWNFDDDELRNCFCKAQLSVKTCSLQGIYTTSSVLLHSPSSLACNPSIHPIDLSIEMMLKYPLNPVELSRYLDLIQRGEEGTSGASKSKGKPKKPYAFVYGHGLWNDLDLQASVNWVDAILEATASHAPYLHERGALWPRLFIPPSASGPGKPDAFILSQGEKPLQLFERAMCEELGRRYGDGGDGKGTGVDCMGTWNMSAQASKYDGVHLDLRGNLVKAMGVMNWLDWIDDSRW